MEIQEDQEMPDQLNLEEAFKMPTPKKKKSDMTQMKL